MKRHYIAIFLVILVSTTSATAHADEPAPVLIKATFFSHTTDRDKDHDTGVYVVVSTSDGRSIIARANDQDNSTYEGTQYKEGSNHQFDLGLDRIGLAKSACKSFTVRVWQRTHHQSHDVWEFDARLVLLFSDGTSLTASRNGIRLKNDKASIDFVAHYSGYYPDSISSYAKSILYS